MAARRRPHAVAALPLLMAFDLLCHDRRDLTGRPLRDCHVRLEDVWAGGDLVFAVRRLAPDVREDRSCRSLAEGSDGFGRARPADATPRTAYPSGTSSLGRKAHSSRASSHASN